ncbi:hypothetical protein REH65_14835 [Saccharopolyspora sp. ID03-671]|uniref:hypothetical protein n=1 Tax=Saccharopolyspora sp. ID03-671 TaxID=3073066 RepID=UPI00325214FE
MSAELPPRPDAATGEPRPPAGPLVLGPPPQESDELESAGKPPPEHGPALETLGHQRFHMLGGTGTLVVLVGIAFTWIHGDLTWMQDPVPWGLIGLLIVFAVVRDWNSTQLTAGADWLRVNRRWVDTYELVEIRLTGAIRGWTLHLADREGRKARAYIATIETNRKLWALVYNGMSHSVHNGAQINNLAAGILRLRPGFEDLQAEAHRPKIPDRVAWTFLFLIVVAFVAVYLLRPELLGPALAVFAVVVLVALAVFGVVVARTRKREKSIDADVADQVKHEDDL